MNYATTRKAIATILRAIPGIGKVFEHERYTTDWATFMSRYGTPNPMDADLSVFNVAWITRRMIREEGLRDEALTMVRGTAVEEWEVVFLYGHSDADDVEQSSEAIFQETVDAIAEAFRWIDPSTAGFPDGTLTVDPVVTDRMGLTSEADVLVHRATIRVLVTMFDDTV